MKAIFVPTDYSKEAQSALWYALDMSIVSKAEVILFHAFHHPVFSPYAYDEEALKQELEEERLQRLNSYAKEVADSFCKYYTLISSTSQQAKAECTVCSTNGSTVSIYLDEEKIVTINTVCRFGLAEDEIMRAGSTYKADLIVMGMRGAGPISQALLGSTTLAVMQESKVPVVAVPLQVRFEGLASVVLAVDPEKLPGADTLQPLHNLATNFNSKLSVLQLHKDHTAEQEQAYKLRSSTALQSCLPNLDYKLYASRGEDVAAGIQQFLDAKQADMLVLVPQRHNFLSRLRNKSITGQMAAKTAVPLLALPFVNSSNLVLDWEQVVA